MKLSKEQELLQAIITKAWEDDTFKQELISDPRKAIESIKGEPIQLLEGKTIVVRDQTDESTIFINIPAKLNTVDMELNEEQLEIIAGGGILSDPFKF